LVIGFGFMGIGVTMRSITALMFGRAFTGLMAGGQPIAMAATADLSTPETKAHNMSLISFVISLGVVIGPLVGGVFSDRNISADFSLSTPFYVAALLAVVAYFWVLFGLREPHHEKKPRKLSFFRPIVLFIEAFESKRIRLLAFVFLLVQIAWALYFQLSNFILSVDFHYNSAALGIFTTSIGVWFAVALFLIFPIFNKRCNIETIAIYSFVVLAIGLLLTAFIPSDIAVWILAFVAAAADIIAYSAMMTIFSNSADESSQGWVMGIFAAIISISWVISGALMNLVPVIGPHVLLAFGGVALIVGAIFMGAFKHHLES
ncbi:MAG: MFS transporter, partial [Simkaniaceae bacterium]|nr:MFS transporter [Simkaniaceae bacterium]